MNVSAFERLARMDRKQAAFRIRGEIRKTLERTHAAVAAPRWNRRQLALEMLDLRGSPEWTRARSAIQRADYRDAQIALVQYFLGGRSAFPLDAVDLGTRASSVQRAFPDATLDAVRRADALVRGEYDLLGYRGIRAGRSIDWHADPINGRRAPMLHWAALPYLDPANGDHKVIWEFNRHQHWLVLGRAYALTKRRQYYDLVREQLESWIRSNPPGMGINWASMLESSFRSISWLWTIAFFAAACTDDHGSDEPWLVDALLGISRQLRHVERNLSLYFSPNTHLTGEALALYVAGCALPGLKASARWTALGREVLLREGRAQVLDDGGHAELSGHYHRYSTDFYLLALTVARAAGDPAAAAFEHTARKQAWYLRTIADDRGHRPSTGDDDGGQLFPICGRRSDDCADTLAIAAILLREPELAVSSIPEEAFWWCGETPEPVSFASVKHDVRSTALKHSGYYVSRNNRGDHLLFDAGRHGFLNGGHAHSDALAIVLTVEGRPLFVDSGTATYTMDGDVRDRFRSTAMHNTVVLDGQPQSEPAGPFHWRTRTNAHARVWRSDVTGGGVDYVEASHNGYAPRLHVRSILAVHAIGWWILDTVIGDGSADAMVHWHLHPAWRATPRDRHLLLEHVDDLTVALATDGQVTVAGPGTTPLAFWSPEYGRVEPTPAIAVTSSGPLPLTLATFIPARAEFTNGLTVERLPVTRVPAGSIGAGWRARWVGGEISLLAAVCAQDTAYESKWSPALWGTPELETDGRVACVVRAQDRRSAVVIDGRRVACSEGHLISAQLAHDILHIPVTNMAPLVHEHDAAELPLQ